MPNAQEEMIELRAAVRAISDELAIMKLLSRYGPAADAADHDAYIHIYTDDGVLDSRGNAVFDVHQVMGDENQIKLVKGGCAHIGSLPHVTIDGDTAAAYQYNCMYIRAPVAEGSATKAMGLARLSFVRNDLERVAGSWKIKRRISAPIEGAEGVEAQQMFREVYQHEVAGR